MTPRARRPVVLLPPDLDVTDTHRGPLPRIVVQRYYTTRILDAGGVPLIPPPVQHLDDAAAVLDQLVALADALVLPGGGFDIDPRHYGEEVLPACGERKPERTDLELALLQRAVARGLPVLGICGGMQLMNVVRGGSLYQDLPSQKPSDVGHMMVGSKALRAHDVDVVAGTKLAAITGCATLAVNSTHHQAIKAVGQALVVNARATDGIVEGIEDPALPFFVGVQWHPEAMNEEPHRAIYRALVRAAVDVVGHTR
jgi:putative glutamine amidotransferase